ncbi:MAG: ABC transporter substrate-binding protein [Promethearchaeota archaeon]
MIKMIEKASSKKRFPNIKEFKKIIIVGGSIISLAIVGIISGIIIMGEIPQGGILKVGITKPIGEIDPLMYSFSSEEIVINHVTETLFDNIYIGGKSQTLPHLALDGNWSSDYLNFTCTLRKNVMFHDGTPFNAAAVKWNFDRITQIIDSSLLSWYLWGYLFFLPDGRWIVNKTLVLDSHIVKFVLNDVFVPFRELLTHSTTSILSPSSTPADKPLNTHIDNLVGTGPFIYDGYEPNVNMSLSPNQDYWGTKPEIDKVILKFYSPTNDTNRINILWNALLAGEIHIVDRDFIKFLIRFYPERSIELLKGVAGITVQQKPTISYFYVFFYPKLINSTMRKAISYAINYSNILEIVPNSITARSPIPEGIPYSNITGIDIPYYNISKARQMLIDEGWPGTAGLTANDNITAGNEWEQLVTNGFPLAIYNLSYYPGNPYNELPPIPFPENLKQLGVNVSCQPIWSGAPSQLETLMWMYDYNDPHTGMLDYHSKWTLWTDFNVSVLDELIEEGIKETNPVLREAIYYNIQKLIIEEICPVIFTLSPRNLDIYASNLIGWQIYPFKIVFKTVYFV